MLGGDTEESFWEHASIIPQDDDVDLPVGARGGNWGRKLHRGAQWVRKGKLVAWSPYRDDWEVEERARKRIKKMLPSSSRSPSPPRFSHLRSPSPPLLAPYAPPIAQHLSFTSFVLDPAAQHSFRSGMLRDLERATCGLVEGEAALRRAMGRLWEVLNDDAESQSKDRYVEPVRSTTVPKQEDTDGEEAGLSDHEEDSGYEDGSFTPPETVANLYKIFINTQANGTLHTEHGLPTPVYESTGTAVAHQQEEMLEKALSTLHELQEDGREYVERLEEIREGLGSVRSQKSALWTVVRERALKEMEQEEI